jgi:formimidoylglutamate deiminase
MPSERKPSPSRDTAPKPPPPSGPTETGWLPDCVYTGEKFETGLAFFADALGRIARFSREPADLSRARRLAGQAALPGLVDTHASSLYRLLRGRDGSGLEEKIAAKLGAAEMYDAARLSFAELLLSGVTCAGELHEPARGVTEPGGSAREILRAAHDVGIRVALFHPAPATGTLDSFVREMEALRTFVEKDYASDEAWLGLAVRDMAAVAPEQLKALATYAHAQRFRVQALGSRLPPALVDKRCTAIGGTQLTDDDLKLIGSARATICVCPGTEPLPALAKLLAAGVSIALGSGRRSRGHLLTHARELERALGGATPAFHAATVTGARSLGATGGALEIGRPADFFTVNLLDPSLAGADPTTLLNHVLLAGDRRAIHEVWLGARQVIAGGRHPQQGVIVSRFAELQKRLAS